ncbi:DUF2637 domain-containing protein [Nocardia sp. BMG51109]|uniref:DUF2637 domain-containing protein n=1 Tax=Nocardia sp. BMG51109 TaxID=1056816 RepID=UPI0004B90538|nr:DUF2637 domain-containing protein [Nocardia sp. BMG51109]
MSTPDRSSRGRLVSWVGFVFGSLTSIAANVLHTWLPAEYMPPGWHPGIAPQIGAAVWPIGLLLSVEVLSRARWRRGRLWALARYGGAGAVAVGSAIISYSHLRDVLITWGYGTWAASVGPITLDGLMVVSGFALLSMTLDRETPAPATEPGGESPAAPAATVTRPAEEPPVPSRPHVEALADVASGADTYPGTAIGTVPEAVTQPGRVDIRGGQDTNGDDAGADTRRATARRLHGQGWTQARIAGHLSVSKRTVRRYLSTPATTPPDPAGTTADPADTAADPDHVGAVAAGPVVDVAALEALAVLADSTNHHPSSSEGVLA